MLCWFSTGQKSGFTQEGSCQTNHHPPFFKGGVGGRDAQTQALGIVDFQAWNLPDVGGDRGPRTCGVIRFIYSAVTFQARMCSWHLAPSWIDLVSGSWPVATVEPLTYSSARASAPSLRLDELKRAFVGEIISPTGALMPFFFFFFLGPDHEPLNIIFRRTVGNETTHAKQQAFVHSTS